MPGREEGIPTDIDAIVGNGVEDGLVEFVRITGVEPHGNGEVTAQVENFVGDVHASGGAPIKGVGRSSRAESVSCVGCSTEGYAVVVMPGGIVCVAVERVIGDQTVGEKRWWWWLLRGAGEGGQKSENAEEQG